MVLQYNEHSGLLEIVGTGSPVYDYFRSLSKTNTAFNSLGGVFQNVGGGGGCTPGAIMDNWSFAGQDADIVLTSNQFNGAAQSITGNGNDICQIALLLKKTGTPTGNITFHVWEHTGTFGSSSSPGALVATSEALDVSTLTTSYQQIALQLTTPFTTVNGTKYCIGCLYGDAITPDGVKVGRQVVGEAHAGNAASRFSSNNLWDVSAGADVNFEVRQAA